MKGSFGAVCELPNPEDFSCTPSLPLGLANISIDLPGELTVNFTGLRPVGSAVPGGYLVDATESFTSGSLTTVPEPSAIFLFLLGILAVIIFPLRRFGCI